MPNSIQGFIVKSAGELCESLSQMFPGSDWLSVLQHFKILIFVLVGSEANLQPKVYCLGKALF